MSPQQRLNFCTARLPSTHELELKTSTPLVLIVDDDDDNLLLMGYVLEMLGVSFLAANSGYEGIQIAHQHRFSLVLLNISMPQCDGIQVLKRLQRTTHYRRTPIVAVTALASKRDRSRLLTSGFTNYLVKPYMIDDVSRLVKQYLPIERLKAG